jgi:hypothetical protein
MSQNHTNILLEQLSSEFKVFGEGLSTVIVDVAEIKADLKKTNEKVDLNSFQIRMVRDDLSEFKNDTQSRLGSIEAKLENHERHIVNT